MNGKLFAQAITKVISGVLLVGFLLFFPAGSFLYWNGWLLIAVLFVPMIVAGFVMMKKKPELLRKRLNAKEEQSEQKIVIVLSGVMFLAAFIVAGLNFVGNAYFNKPQHGMDNVAVFEPKIVFVAIFE